MHIHENDFGNFEIIGLQGQVVARAYSPQLLSDWLDRQYAPGMGVDLNTPDTRQTRSTK